MHPSPPITRRRFHRQALAGAALACGAAGRSVAASGDRPRIRTITQGPAHHWFGYYDKLQFSQDDRFVLTNRVGFEHRSPLADDVIEVGMIDTESRDEWIPLGTSKAWCWQQGCTLQWLPGHASKVIWNDRERDRFPDVMAPDETGVTHVDLETGTERLIVSHHEVATTGEVMRNGPDSKHHVYHLLHSPNGRRFIMLHRWTLGEGGFLTRLLTAETDGSGLRIVIPNGYASHFVWRDDGHILSQSKGWLGNKNWGNFLFADEAAAVVEEVGKDVLDPGGHFSYFSNQDWLVSDTYPKGPERLQTPHLYQISTNRRIDLGSFPCPKEYQGEWRVDTHPRVSRTEKWVCIDSPHNGAGRQLHLIDIRGLMG